MLWWLIPLLLFGVSIALAGVIVARRIPQIRLLDVLAMPKEKMRKTKEKIILERFERMGKGVFGRAATQGGAAVAGVSRAGRRAVQKLYALEQYYERLKKISKPGALPRGAVSIQKLMDEATELSRADEFLLAEKKLIEVISQQPKNVGAYELLGNVYLRAKQYDQARETLQFALRLDANDASVHMSMAELEMVEGHPSLAVEHVRQSVEKRPHNPKYLDTYIEASLAAGMVEDAKNGIELLKAANPENQKISEFEERVKNLPL